MTREEGVMRCDIVTSLVYADIVTLLVHADIVTLLVHDDVELGLLKRLNLT